jgi:hypothetical protein
MEDNFSEKKEELEVNEQQNLSVDTEEETNEQVEDFTSWSKQDMFGRLKEIINNDDIEGNQQIVNVLKDLYRAQLKEENMQKLQQYLNEGGVQEDFAGVKTEMDEAFEELVKKFFHRKKEIKAQKEKELRTNLAVKRDIVDELKKLAKTTEDISQAFDKFHNLQNKWRETGKVPVADAEDLWQNYRLYVDQFFAVVNLNKELREIDKGKNIELKTALCEKAEQLSQTSSVKKAVSDLKKLLEEWKDVGYIPKEENDLLWERFKTASDVIYERQKAHKEEIKGLLEENLKAKNLLCEQMEKLLEQSPSNHKEWQQESLKVDALMDEWKKIGFVPKSDKGEAWEKFKSLRKEFFHRQDAYYGQQKQVFTDNLKKKTDLCERAEALKDSEDFDKTANELIKLQAEWKKVGPVSQKYSDKIWKRFRAACDLFFERKNKAREGAVTALKLNSEKRREIIKQISDLVPSENKDENIEILKNYQQQFEEAGEVSEREKEELTRKFNDACDRFLQKLKEKTGEDASDFYKVRYESLLKSEEGKNKIKKERREIEEKIKRIQSEITQVENNLGFFSKSKNSASLLADFQSNIDKGKADIKKLKEELARMPRIEEPQSSKPLGRDQGKKRNFR